jgi:hypothetical protein
MLSDDYLRAAEHRARRFSGSYTGTSGTLAADVIRLLNLIRHQRKEIVTMEQTLEEANLQLRTAVEARLGQGCAADAACCEGEAEESPEEPAATIPVDWILRGERELHEEEEARLPGDGILATPCDNLRPGSREFLAVLEELKDLHLRKTLDYGVDEDALSNIRQSADVVNMPAWSGCILRISDKMHRLRAYFRRGKTEFDGIEDTLKDIACYAAIALVLHRESDRE